MPSAPRSDSVNYGQPAPWSFNADYDANGNAVYIGRAVPGDSDEASPVWQIQKNTFVAIVIGADTFYFAEKVRWADGDDRFDNVWNDRASLDYS